jgi:FtsH-binding integral membrane protein
VLKIIKPILKNKKLLTITFWLWVAMIAYFTFTPHSPKLRLDIKEQSFRLDYLFHFIVYFGLTVLYFLWKSDKNFKIKTKFLLYFIFTAILFSGISEILQHYIPDRSFNPIDFYSNTAGIILGVFVPMLKLKLIR